MTPSDNSEMNFIIITGLSGAGKTVAMHALEDIDFYCVDNLPPELIPTFYDLCRRSSDEHMKKLAVVVDTRGGEVFDSLFSSLVKLSSEGAKYKILFLDAHNDIITSRFKLTRRKHPLADDMSGSIEDAINAERTLLKRLRNSADFIIDTSYLSSAQLKERVLTLFLGNNLSGMSVMCMSFGFKYGFPGEADVMFDVRCLPNPYYVEELKNKTGLDSDVFSYVMDSEKTKGLLERIESYVDYCLPLYADEGKSQLVIAVGCTGGKHRSVTLAQELYRHLCENGIRAGIHHRDIRKP